MLRTLFSDISFEIQAADHVGLVGVNGSGKTTLLNIILGTEPADEGRVTLASGIKIAKVEQLPDFASPVSLYDFVLQAHADVLRLESEIDRVTALLLDETNMDRHSKLAQRQETLLVEYTRLDGTTYKSRTRSALLGLGFSASALDRPISTFSGGQVSKAMLARAILSGAALLVLDEPTNNLDLPSITWLEDYLSRYKGAILVVSHDRAFLDAVTNRTLELENGHIISSKGNYSKHLELKLDAKEAAMKLYLKQCKEIKRIEGIIDQQRRWNQERNYVTIASKQKEIDRIREGLVPPERDPAAIHFHFSSAAPTGNEVIVTRGLTKSFDGKLVFENCDLFIKRSECVCLIGANGCGKTTLLKILAGRIPPTDGVFKIGAGVKLGYYEQDTRRLTGEHEVIRELSDMFPRMDTAQLRNALGMFLFRGDDIYKKVNALSGGERARIQLLKLVLGGANVLLLDEPTNHLDIQSAEMLERAIEAFEGTVLIVTHDRYLVNRLADRVVVMKRNGMTAQRDENEDMFRLVTPEPDKDDEPAATEPPAANLYQRQKEHKAAVAKARQRVSAIKRDVTAAEKAAHELEAGISGAQERGEYRRIEQLCIELAKAEDKVLSLYDALTAAEEELNTLADTEV